ncbi:unnamed protein product [Didymodactylos carnosus]|uniref:Uncharacterized protein n=1 Tax=Didymodactylos carnosus TaxID=1234261 RepID=A0A8S2FA44_9BILA|nr:unnamed protein product [Didymodactylos carnosus]CAF4205921.1 unnamed protein product [Didymodactylos carnosus]
MFTNTRDFRSSKNWVKQTINQQIVDSTTIVYTMTIANPAIGWKGFFIQINFSDSAQLTTEVLIVPNSYPAGDCMSQCYGTLV